MAEASFNNQEKKICPYFLKSSCWFGDRCRFSHRIPEVEICSFYLEGRCRFGDSCWNRHSTLESNVPSIYPSRNNKPSPGPSRIRPESQRVTSPPNLNQGLEETPQPLNRFRTTNNTVKAQINEHIQRLEDIRSEWTNSAEFIPTSRRKRHQFLNPELCSDFMNGRCSEKNRCSKVHGDICELCFKACLDPFDKEQQREHIESCTKELEQKRELQFAIQRSEGKTCGICMDVIIEKDDECERKFGILENCNHIFCFDCIMKWRRVQSRNFDVDNVVDPSLAQNCPECRTPSEFITPSNYWFDTEKDKKKLIADHKTDLGQRHCRYFRRGEGRCPFGGSCYYLHALPNGRKVNLPPPERRSRVNNGEMDFMSRFLLLDFLEDPDALEFDNFMLLSSDSEFEDEDDLSFFGETYFSHARLYEA